MREESNERIVSCADNQTYAASASYGDKVMQKIVERGDPVVQAFYGSVTLAAGQVDGLLKLLMETRGADIAEWRLLTQAIRHTRERITAPILSGEIPMRNAVDVISVREARIVLQGWIVVGVVTAPAYTNYLAQRSSDETSFRLWFEYVQGRMSRFLLGHVDRQNKQHPISGEPRTAASALYELVHDVANAYVALMPQAS